MCSLGGFPPELLHYLVLKFNCVLLRNFRLLGVLLWKSTFGPVVPESGKKEEGNLFIAIGNGLPSSRDICKHLNSFLLSQGSGCDR